MTKNTTPLTSSEIKQFRELAYRLFLSRKDAQNTPTSKIDEILQMFFDIEPPKHIENITLDAYYSYLEELPKEVIHSRFKRIINLAQSYGMFLYVGESPCAYIKRCLDELIRRGAVHERNLPTFPLYQEAVNHTNSL